MKNLLILLTICLLVSSCITVNRVPSEPKLTPFSKAVREFGRKNPTKYETNWVTAAGGALITIVSILQKQRAQ